MKGPALSLVLFPSWLCFISLAGHLFCSTSHFLGLPFWPNPRCGTSYARELPDNLVPQLYPHLSHFSITAPSNHLHACANLEGKGSKHPMGQPLTIGRWEDGSWWKKCPTYVSGDNFQVHSTQPLKGPQGDCIPVALSSNQLIIYLSTGFHSFPVPFCLATTPHTSLLPKINKPSSQALIKYKFTKVLIGKSTGWQTSTKTILQISTGQLGKKFDC